MTPETLQKIENHIAQQPSFSIDIKDEELLKNITLEDFIKSFHTGPIARCENIQQNGQPVEGWQRRRSLVDTIIACQSTMNASVNDVLQVFRKAHQEKRMVGWYCRDIKRFVLRIDFSGWDLNDQEKHDHMNVHIGEFDYGTGITFNDIFSNAENM